MKEVSSCTIVTITDKNFVLAVFILVLSLKYHKVNSKIKILGINLSESDIKLLTQFDNVEVVKSMIKNPSDRTSLRAIANICKREAILSAKTDNSDFVALLDGDCIVTGDISPYLTPSEPGLFLRIRSTEENNMIFQSRYQAKEKFGTIPKRVLEKWQKDVNGNPENNIVNTVLSGNLIIHKNYFGFVDHWGDFMETVLPYHQSTFDHVAYEMMGDFTLSAMLAFAKDAPPIKEMMLNKDVKAYVAHLGPKPKFWELWPKSKLKYFHQILKMLDWARKTNVTLPVLPWTLQRKYMLKIYVYAYLYQFYFNLKKIIRPIYNAVSSNFKNRKHKY